MGDFGWTEEIGLTSDQPFLFIIFFLIILMFSWQVDNMGVMVMATAHYLRRNIHL